MFKNSKEKNDEFINRDELEKIYNIQKRAFESKIMEQQKTIDELVNYISARFGEDIENSNVATKLKDIENNLKEIETKYKTNLEKHTQTLKKEIEKEGNKIASELNDSNTKTYFKLLQKNENDMAKIKNIFDGKDKKIFELERTVKEHIKNNEIYKKEIKDEIKETHQKISKINYLGISTKFEKKIKEESQKTNDKIELIITNEKEKFEQKVSNLNDKIQNNGETISKLDERLSKSNGDITQKFENVLSELDEKYSKKTKTADTNIQETKNKILVLKEQLLKDISIVNEKLQNNENTISKLQEDEAKEIEQLKLEISENINKHEEKISNKNIKLEEKIKQVKENLKTTKNELKTIESKFTTKLEELKQENSNLYIKYETDTNEKINSKMQDVISELEKSKLEITNLDNKINSDIDQLKKDTFNISAELKTKLDEQITNINNENKVQLENIITTFEQSNETMENSINNIGQEITKLKEETSAYIEKQGVNNSDLGNLKKDYNKYIVKMNNELAKISKTILNTQKKNLEANQNLQVKIKAYIDNKIEKVNNTQKVEERINSLNLSILEKEKLQKIEMEELLNKKLKQIQKENEKMLNKKIEELAIKLTRENIVKAKPNLNKVTFYEEQPKNKKNTYELIDNNQILKRSAASKNPIETTKEGKSQILKFFYDD